MQGCNCACSSVLPEKTQLFSRTKPPEYIKHLCQEDSRVVQRGKRKPIQRPLGKCLSIGCSPSGMEENPLPAAQGVPSAALADIFGWRTNELLPTGAQPLVIQELPAEQCRVRVPSPLSPHARTSQWLWLGRDRPSKAPEQTLEFQSVGNCPQPAKHLHQGRRLESIWN